MFPAVVLVSHGSRYPKTKEEVMLLVSRIREASSFEIIEYAFLEIEHPSIPEAIEQCVVKGAGEIIILLNFLNSGQHVDKDIPAICEEARIKYPGVNIRMTGPVGQHPDILNLFLDLLLP